MEDNQVINDGRAVRSLRSSESAITHFPPSRGARLLEASAVLIVSVAFVATVCAVRACSAMLEDQDAVQTEGP